MTKVECYQYDKLPAKVKSVLHKAYDMDAELFEYRGLQAVILDISDSVDCVKQYKLYMSKKGDIYERDTHKEPTTEMFVKLYLGEYDGYDFEIPDIFICSNKSRATELFKILSGVSYHNTFLQRYTDVELIDNVITVFSGSYR